MWSPTHPRATQNDTGWRLARKAKIPELIQSGLPIDDESTKRYIIAGQMIVALKQQLTGQRQLSR